MRALFRTFVAAVALSLSACVDDGHLRGHVTASPDGNTYLAIVDDRDGCALKVDGRLWTAGAGEAQPISPGEHTIDCDGEEIGFIVPEGVVFNFDYWGP